MNVLKKFKIINPRTGNKIEIPSALASDDPKLKDLGKKKAKDIISKAKEKMKGGGIDKKLDKDGSVTVKGYEKDAGGYDDSNPMRAPIQYSPQAKKSFTFKKDKPKPSTNPDDYSADGQYLGPGGGISPGGQKVSGVSDKPEPKKEKLPPELQKVKDDAVEKSKQMAKDHPFVTSPIQDPNNYKYYHPGEFGHYRQTGFDPSGEFAVDAEKRAKKRDKPDDEQPNQDDYSADGQYLGPGGGISPGGQRVSGVQGGREFNPNRLRRDGKSRKEAKQYVKENKEEVLKYVIRQIIKEEKENLITEGTRWLVGIEQPNGKVTSTYGHYDGYPEWAGKH